MNNIRRIRRAKNITQNELAEKIGVSNSVLSRIEAGKVVPSERRLNAIAAALDVSPDSLTSAASPDPSTDYYDYVLDNGIQLNIEAHDSPLKYDSSRSQVMRTSAYIRALLRTQISMYTDGKCELCGKPAPFSDNNGDPYLELHFIDDDSDVAKPDPSNAVVLCPNCHRKIHVLGNEEDNKVIESAAASHTWKNSIELAELLKNDH